MTKIKKSIEYLFYLLLITYFMGKLFEPITITIDILFCYYLYKNKTETIKLYHQYKNLIFSFILLLIYFAIQSIAVGNGLVSFEKSFGTIRFIILFFAALLVFDTKKKIYYVIYASFVGIGIVCIDSLYQYFNGVDLLGKASYANGARLTAWNHAPKINSMMGEFFGLLICAPIILKKEKKFLAIFMLITAGTIFILSGNRAPIVALFSTIIIIGIFSEKKKYIIGFVLLFALVFAFALSTKRQHSSLSAILNPTTNQATSGRWPIYLTGVEIIKEHPLFGIGAKQFYTHFEYYYKKVDFKNKYKKYYKKSLAKHPPLHLDSIFLDMFTSYGLFGFIFYTIILYQVFKYFIYKNNLGLIASIGFFYCITPLQFSRSFTQSEWQFITYLGLILLAILSKYNKIEVLKQKKKDEKKY